MKLHDGTKVLATPSILYRDGYAVVAVNGGEGGYLYLREDGMETDTDGTNRYCYVYRVFDDSMDMLSEGDDIRSGAVPATNTVWHRDGGERRMLEGTRSLVSFLSACAESLDEESENYNLFDGDTRNWAEMNSENLSMISVEIEEELNES